MVQCKYFFTFLFFILSFDLRAATTKTFNLEYDHVPGELIVRFKKAQRTGARSLLALRGLEIVHSFRLPHTHLVRLSEGRKSRSLLETAKEIARLPNVAHVEANTIVYMNRRKPNDPKFSELYGLENSGSTGGSKGSDISATKAWQQTTGSKDVLVAIIDSGVDYNHPDLKDNYWTNPGESGLDSNGNDKSTNGIDDDNNGFIDDFRGWDFANDDNDPMDDNDHGTHCAGTIGAVGDNQIGITGVNWQVSMVGIKFIGASGNGSLDAAIKAIDYATLLGVDISNNSWGGGSPSVILEETIERSRQRGILFVAAAGNTSQNNDQDPHYPASFALQNVISVAATDHNDALASFSCYGATTVDLAAPGVDIMSTVRKDKYESFSGTSMATPHVSGVAALIKSKFPNASYEQIKYRILSNVDYVAGIEDKVKTKGRINAFKAMEVDTVPPGKVEDLKVTSVGINSISLSWLATGDDDKKGHASAYEVKMHGQAIDTEKKWQDAKWIGNLHSLSSPKSLRFVVKDLPFNSSGYISVRAVDNTGNFGPLSQSIRVVVKPVYLLTTNEANSLKGVKTDEPWGVEKVENENVFSDSPNGDYSNNTDASLTLDKITVNNRHLVFSFDTKYMIESVYDNGFVEISIDDGQSFSEVMRFTGEMDGWVTKTADLGRWTKNARSITVRFRLETDGSLSEDGWWIDNISFFEVK